MNSIWNKNISLFTKRFPQLSTLLSNKISNFENNGTLSFELANAKNNSPTALENNMPLHSKYNPEKDAENLFADFDIKKVRFAVFFSFGLGYAPIFFSQKYPSVPIIIVEPDCNHLFSAFTVLDWQSVLEHNEIIFAVDATAEETATILSKHDASCYKIFSVQAQTLHAKNFYEELKRLLEKQNQKKEINLNTLEKFSHLWLRNSCRNLHYLAELDGVNKYENSTTLPFVILAAGPSLSSILPYLAEIKKRAVLVCVDTALHACSKAKVEPDFIILVDPQYACSLHLEFLSSPSSVLILESAVYPSVFRFNCKEKVLCSSLFPIGQYFEKKLGNKGKLGAGGSVTTTAWDFACLCGAKEIYLAGMDLGFPSKQTHIRGSQFEEKAHRISCRKTNAETNNISSLFSASPSISKDYNGNELLTDKRMSLFSWWFESNCKRAKETQNVHTYTLTSESLMIPEIEVSSINLFLQKQNQEESKKIFYNLANKKSEQLNSSFKNNYYQVLNDFTNDLQTLYIIAKKGLSLSNEAISNINKIPTIAVELNKLDSQIMNSNIKDAASLVFPTERQLDKEASNIPKDKLRYSFYYSRLIYTELLNAISEYKKYLLKEK